MRARRWSRRSCATRPPSPCFSSNPAPHPTARHEAAASGGPEIIRLLLDHKVDPKLKSKQNVTALDLAKEYKNQAAIELLNGR